jgi:hypothetical protein
LFVYVALASQSAYAQFDPAKILGPLKLGLPDGDSGKLEGETIRLTECVDPSNYTFDDGSPDSVRQNPEVGVRFTYAEVEKGRVWEISRKSRWISVVTWPVQTFHQFFDRARQLSTAGDLPSPPKLSLEP